MGVQIASWGPFSMKAIYKFLGLTILGEIVWREQGRILIEPDNPPIDAGHPMNRVWADEASNCLIIKPTPEQIDAVICDWVWPDKQADEGARKAPAPV